MYKKNEGVWHHGPNQNIMFWFCPKRAVMQIESRNWRMHVEVKSPGKYDGRNIRKLR